MTMLSMIFHATSPKPLTCRHGLRSAAARRLRLYILNIDTAWFHSPTFSGNADSFVLTRANTDAAYHVALYILLARQIVAVRYRR